MAASPSTPRQTLPWIVAFTAQAYQWLLGACPPDFRRNYGREMAQVFRQCCQDAYRQRGRRGVLRLWLPTLIDLLTGVIAEYGRAFALAYARRNTMNRLRSTERTVFWSFIGFVLGYVAFLIRGQSLVLSGYDGQNIFYSTYYCVGYICSASALKTPLNHPGAIQPHAQILAALSQLFIVCSLVALFAVLAGVLPIGYALLRRAIATRQIKVLLLLAVHVLALGVVVGYTLLFAKVLIPGSVTLSDLFALLLIMLRFGGPGNLELFSWLWVALVVLATIASAAAVSRAVSRVQVSGRLVRLALIPAGVATMAMALVLVSVMIPNTNTATSSNPTWTIVAFVDGPFSPLSTLSDQAAFVTAWWLVAMELMVLSTGIAAFSILRHFLRRARPTLQPAATT